MIFLYHESIMFGEILVSPSKEENRFQDYVGMFQNLPLGGFEWVLYVGF